MRHCYAQYLDLMLVSGGFFTWANAYEHAKTQSLVVDETAALDARIGLVLDSMRGIDVSLRRLADALPTPGPAGSFDDVVQALAAGHDQRAAEPVIVDQYEPEPGEALLEYPSRSDAFVPQAYTELRYPGERISLEDERLWAARRPGDDGC
ncbi:hypothetical protein Dvina_36150 [Dactylosporangium vinaceum]|uniref:Uncharacterized protein n=1 Tax=Dactylosporangium vinaceum TaxID=53362 RepID=A0ABV5MJA0_9ACTN|nr:hypothetical protein [Dactylosporangium vinaceum]UAB93635.1 hypothetical protein Dvina_36150 [Dactylosporangium vinaceum]